MLQHFHEVVDRFGTFCFSDKTNNGQLTSVWCFTFDAKVILHWKSNIQYMYL